MRAWVAANPGVPYTRPWEDGDVRCADHPACAMVVQEGETTQCFLCWSAAHATTEEG